MAEQVQEEKTKNVRARAKPPPVETTEQLRCTAGIGADLKQKADVIEQNVPFSEVGVMAVVPQNHEWESRT